MALSREIVKDLLDRGYSRRNIAKIALGAAAAVPFFNEFAQAQQSEEDANGDRDSERERERPGRARLDTPARR